MKIKIKVAYLRFKDWTRINSQKIKTALYSFGITFFIFFIAVTLASAVNLPLGINVFTVLTGSMKPAIPAGSVIFTRESKFYYQDDIITFNSTFQKLPVTHRIIEMEKKDGVITYQTKGDFNPSPDFQDIHDKDIIGKVMFHLPLLGFIINFAKTVPGFVIIIIIPSVIIVYEEIKSAKDELKKLSKKRKERKHGNNTDTQIQEKKKMQAVLAKELGDLKTKPISQDKKAPSDNTSKKKTDNSSNPKKTKKKRKKKKKHKKKR